MPFQPKPEWIKVRAPGGSVTNRISTLLRKRNLHTVCEEALCPNMGACWKSGTATLLLMGGVCTRGCRFCSIQSGKPLPLDPSEPEKTAETVKLMNLRYVVLTSVDRDDLEDQGSNHFARVIETIHEHCPDVLVEALIPDFQGRTDLLSRILTARPDVLGHNIETVERLTPTVRDRRCGYRQSLDVLAEMKRQRPEQWTKSSLMLGLGETRDEIRTAFADLLSVGVDFLTLGQYLQPTKKHLPVVEFVRPEKFEELRREGEEIGFRYVASAPLVRSSYKAGEFFIETVVRNHPRNGGSDVVRIQAS
ncbi:MAG: lipoyl synthase [Pseudomonadota bacterium]